jgi:hypothetical protein
MLRRDALTCDDELTTISQHRPDGGLMTGKYSSRLPFSNVPHTRIGVPAAANYGRAIRADI